MKSVFIASIAVVVLAAFPAGARNTTGTENGKELTTSQITLPPLADGIVAVQVCSACNRFTYTMNAATRFYIGDAEVSYGEYTRYVASHPEAFIHLVTPINQNIVKRLIAK
jgi:hypothetical protein